jgi:hypothetical protein
MSGGGSPRSSPLRVLLFLIAHAAVQSQGEDLSVVRWIRDPTINAFPSTSSTYSEVMRYFVFEEDMSLSRRRVAYPTQATGEKLPLGAMIRARPFAGMAPLRTHVRYPRIEVDVDMILAIPIVRASVAQVLVAIAGTDIECIETTIDGENEPFFAINVLRKFDCVDETRTRIQRATPDDPAPGGGRYRSVGSPRIIPAAVGDAHIFRIADWPAPILVSETVRAAMAEHEVTGIVFIDA